MRTTRRGWLLRWRGRRRLHDGSASWCPDPGPPCGPGLAASGEREDDAEPHRAATCDDCRASVTGPGANWVTVRAHCAHFILSIRVRNNWTRAR